MIAYSKAGHSRTDLLYDAGTFVAEHHRDGIADGAFHDTQVTLAQATGANSDGDFAVARWTNFQIVDGVDVVSIEQDGFQLKTSL